MKNNSLLLKFMPLISLFYMSTLLISCSSREVSFFPSTVSATSNTNIDPKTADEIIETETAVSDIKNETESSSNFLNIFSSNESSTVAESSTVIDSIADDAESEESGVASYSLGENFNGLCYVNNISTDNTSKSIKIDKVETSSEFLAENTSGYSILNSEEKIDTYTLSDDCLYELYNFQVSNSSSSDSENTLKQVDVDFDTIKNYISSYSDHYPTRALLFNIYIEDDIVTKLSMCFTP